MKKCKKHDWKKIYFDQYAPIYNVRYVDVIVCFMCAECGETKTHFSKIDKGVENE